MTIEEAIEYISSIVDTYEICHDAKHTSVAVSIGAEDAKALEMAIASLEAWGKVRQEIYKRHNEYEADYCAGVRFGLLDALVIIDKHLQETSETETWSGFHGQITAPKGTFEKIYNSPDEEDDDI
jgi:hypothetical protein